MNTDAKFNLITNNLEEIMNEQELITVLNERNLKIYWGVAPIDKIDIGILIPLVKLAQFLKADCEVSVLFADLHGFLDSNTSTWSKSQYKIKYYIKIIKLILSQLNAPTDKLNFIIGSEYQFMKNYTFDVYKLMSIISVNEINKATHGVISRDTYTKASSIIYPGLQILDEEYLKVDAQLGGIEQKRIFELSDKYLPRLGYKRKIHLINTSRNGYNIDILAETNIILRQINKLNDQQIIKFVKHVVFPKEKLNNKKIKINANEIFTFSYFETFKKSIDNNEISINIIKEYIVDWLNDFLDSVRSTFNKEKNIKLLKLAFG
jgi:tyrosyl-tRNA synthetase